jgi:biotin carboxylase
MLLVGSMARVKRNLNIQKKGDRMSILILNRVSRDLAPYEDWLNHLNEDLILLTSDEYAEDFTPSNFAYFESFSNYNYNANVELRAIELYDRYKYRAIIGLSERDVLRAAYLRDRFGIEGQTWDSAWNFRSKIKMKDLAIGHGLPCPAYREIIHSFDLLEFIEEHKLPVVIKPIDSAGSVGTTVIETQEQLENLLLEGVPHNWEVEKFVEGDLYHVDGFIYHGDLIFTSCSKYVESCLSFHEDGKFTGSYILDQTTDLSKRLSDRVTKHLRIMAPPEHTPFHAEFFHTPDDQIILCEIASRTGGGRVNIQIDQSFGVNLNKSWIYAQLGLPLELPTGGRKQVKPHVLTGSALLPPKKGIFHGFRAEVWPDYVTEYRLLAEQGEKFDGPKSSVDHMASVVVVASTEQEMEERLYECNRLFQEYSIWS